MQINGVSAFQSRVTHIFGIDFSPSINSMGQEFHFSQPLQYMLETEIALNVTVNDTRHLVRCSQKALKADVMDYIP